MCLRLGLCNESEFLVELSEHRPHNLCLSTLKSGQNLKHSLSRVMQLPHFRLLWFPLSVRNYNDSPQNYVCLVSATFTFFEYVCSFFVFPLHPPVLVFNRLVQIVTVYIFFLLLNLRSVILPVGGPTLSFIGFWENDADVSMSWVRPVECAPLIHATLQLPASVVKTKRTCCVFCTASRGFVQLGSWQRPPADLMWSSSSTCWNVLSAMT